MTGSLGPSLTEQLRTATNNKLNSLSALTCSPTQIPCVKRKEETLSVPGGRVSTFTIQPLLQCRLCRQKEGLTKPGLASSSCQQVRLARAPAASCLWPSPFDKSSCRGDTVLQTLQGAAESLDSARNHNSLIRTHWYLCWARLAAVYSMITGNEKNRYMITGRATVKSETLERSDLVCHCLTP